VPKQPSVAHLRVAPQDTRARRTVQIMISAWASSSQHAGPQIKRVSLGGRSPLQQTSCSQPCSNGPLSRACFSVEFVRIPRVSQSIFPKSRPLTGAANSRRRKRRQSCNVIHLLTCAKDRSRLNWSCHALSSRAVLSLSERLCMPVDSSRFMSCLASMPKPSSSAGSKLGNPVFWATGML
jgi:hypothetical protein